jgi:hypothetical protein
MSNAKNTRYVVPFCEWEWKAEDGHMAPYTNIDSLHHELRNAGWEGPVTDEEHP